MGIIWAVEMAEVMDGVARDSVVMASEWKPKWCLLALFGLLVVMVNNGGNVTDLLIYYYILESERQGDNKIDQYTKINNGWLA